MNLRALPIADVTSRDDLFRCIRLGGDSGTGAILSAGCCALRQAKVRRGMQKFELRVCVGCVEGAVIERLSGGPVTPGEHAGSDERSRKRGGIEGPKALASKRRLRMLDAEEAK